MIPFTRCSGKGKTATAQKRPEDFQESEVRGRLYKGTAQGNFEGVMKSFCILSFAFLKTNRTKYQMSKFYWM